MPQHYQHPHPPLSQPRMGTMQPPQSMNGMTGHHHMPPANVFGSVMGNAPGQTPQGPPGGGGLANAKVYASVYSGIPVFEAMIRGISVMRRTSDSWVNATQILKVAGIPKSARTKILEKEILTGMHEKVQGGYGKYQGTWIPYQRGQALAAQYGVTAYAAPIFDFVPSPSNVAALPIVRHGTPDHSGQKTTANQANAMPGYNPTMMSGSRLAVPGNRRMMSPFAHGSMPHPPPPQFANGDGQLMGIPPHPSAMAYHGQPSLYYQPPLPFPTPDKRRHESSMNMISTPGADGSSLAPAAHINGMGLPPSHADVYIDQYGQPHPSYQAQYPDNIDMKPPITKRRRSEDDPMLEPNGHLEELPAEEAEEDDDSLDEIRDAPALPSSMRLSNKPLRPKPSAQSSRTRSKLLSLFSLDEAVDIRSVLGILVDAPIDVDVDTIIDNQGHTALHWACALAKSSIISQLIELGADVHRGNYAGETPLIRSVLTTNHAEAGTFAELLERLAPSVRTLDHAYRTVIHHIALIAGVKGRASSARSYMAGVLEGVAKEQLLAGVTAGQELDGGVAPSLSLKNLVDVEDVHGDSALNVAARVGNKGLVKLLLDAGADKARANKLGLKPQDFGIEIEALWVSPAEAVVSNLKSAVPKPERQSRDVQRNISAIFETINDTFAREMTEKQTTLNATEASVRHATRAIADKRQQVQRAQNAVGDLEQIQQKADNVRRALAMVGSQDWTGRAQRAPTAFQPLPGHIPTPHTQEGLSREVPIPNAGEEDALVKLRRLAIWEDRMAAVLEERMRAVEGASADKAVKYRRLVSLCTKVPVEKVDSMLDGLTAAIESDGQSIDLSRVSSFMHRMKEQTA